MTDSQFLVGFSDFFTSVITMLTATFTAFMGNVVTRTLVELIFLGLIVDIVANFIVKFSGKNKEK